MLIFEYSRSAGIAAALAALATGLSAPASAKTYSEVIAFGDSLSDNGVFFCVDR